MQFQEKLCFILYTKTEDIYNDIAEDIETRFHTSNYELIDRCQNEKIKRVIGVIKYKLSGKIMTKFAGLRAKTYIFLKENLNLKIIKTLQKQFSLITK